MTHRAPEQISHFHIVDKCVSLCGLLVRRPPFETNETIQQVRVFSAKVEYWSLISLAHMMEGENQSLEVSLWPPHVYYGKYSPECLTTTDYHHHHQ